MNAEITVALITTSASIVIAAATFFLTKRAERAAQLQRRKERQYYALLKALAAFYDATADLVAARQQAASAINMIVLVAPQDLVASVMAYYREMLVWPPRREERDRLLKALVLKMRESLELPFVDDPASFDFRLVPVDARVDEVKP
jgi:dipeptide/tripeptide permease